MNPTTTVRRGRRTVPAAPAPGHAAPVRGRRGPPLAALLAAAAVGIAPATAADGDAAADRVAAVAARGAAALATSAAPRHGRLEAVARRDDDLAPERIDRERSTWRRGAGGQPPLEIPTRDVIRWGECPPWPAGPLVLLAGGGVVAGTLEAADAAGATIRSPCLGRVALPAGCVSGFRRSGTGGPGPLAAHVPAATLLLANGDALAAAAPAWRDGTLAVDTAAGRVAIPAELVAAVDLAAAADAAPRTAGPRLLAALADGSRLPLAGLRPAAAPDRLTLVIDVGGQPGDAAPRDAVTDGAATVTAECDRDDVVALLVDGGAARAVASLAPAAYAHEPILGPAWPLAVGRTLTGAWPAAGAVAGFSGLGIHAPASVRYRLDRPATRLVARVAIDDTAGSRGAVVVRVRQRSAAGGWREAFAAAPLRGGDPPLVLDVPLDPRDGGDEIELVVDAADEADVLARTIWLDPLVVATP